MFLRRLRDIEWHSDLFHGRLSGHTGNVWPVFTESDFSCVREMNKWTYYRGMAYIHGEGH